MLTGMADFTHKDARILVAIMFTDLAGYSVLMEKNEPQARKVMEHVRRIQEKSVLLHMGQIIKYIGDGSLIIFGSASDAVSCAIQIQKSLLKQPDILLRIGIHSGEAVVEKGDVYGDCVNIASRVENQAIPGSILITEKIYDEIKNLPEIKTKSLGNYQLKNISQPVQLFAVTNKGIKIPDTRKASQIRSAISAAAESTTADKTLEAVLSRPIPGKKLRRILAMVFMAMIVIVLIFAVVMNRFGKPPEKTIAVLPFVNLSDDPAQEYFSDGITDDIILHLHKIGGFKVTSRTSVMKYKKEDKSAGEIAKELGVNYVLEGSVRKEANQVLVTAQLIKARDDKHVWGEWYNAQLTEIFRIQSDIAGKIASALKTELTMEESRQINKIPTRNLQAYEFYLRGREYYFKYTPENNQIAIQLYKESIARDSSFALAYAGLGNAYARQEFYTFQMTWLDSAKLASERAIAIDPRLADGYKALAMVHDLRGNQKEAIHYNQKALNINPNHIQAWHNLGVTYTETGELEKAVECYNKASQLDPNKSSHLDNYGEIYYLLNEQEKAIQVFRKSLALIPDNVYSLLYQYKIYTVEMKSDKAIAISESIFRITNDLYGHYVRMFGICLITGDMGKAGEYAEKMLAIAKDHEQTNLSVQVPRSDLLTIHFYNTALYLSYWYSINGEAEMADSILRQQLSFYKSQYENGNQRILVLRNLAYCFALQGDKEEALLWLQKAFSSGWREFRQEMQNPLLRNIRENDRFNTLIEQMEQEIIHIKPQTLSKLDLFMDQYLFLQLPQ